MSRLKLHFPWPCPKCSAVHARVRTGGSHTNAFHGTLHAVFTACTELLYRLLAWEVPLKDLGLCSCGNCLMYSEVHSGTKLFLPQDRWKSHESSAVIFTIALCKLHSQNMRTFGFASNSHECTFHMNRCSTTAFAKLTHRSISSGSEIVRSHAKAFCSSTGSTGNNPHPQIFAKSMPRVLKWSCTMLGEGSRSNMFKLLVAQCQLFLFD